MRVLIVVNVDWFFLSHRLPVALGAVQEGHEVHVATSLTESQDRLKNHGFLVHPIQLHRSEAGPVSSLKLLFQFFKLFREIKPDVVHLVTIKPVLIGGLAARLASVGGVVYAISGLGHVFLAESLYGKVRRALVSAWYRLVLGKRNIRVIFQNPDDKLALQSVAVLRPLQMVMIPGSGVDLVLYQSTPLPRGVTVVFMAARLLTTKGVLEFVQAAELLKAAAVNVRFCLVGDPDPANPDSISAQMFEDWKRAGVVEVLGYRTDISTLMAQAHVVVLPSYREGLPKVLIEAAACGRAVVTTDVPGCRDAILPGVTGLLVPPKNAQALAQAIERLVKDPKTCAEMGHAGRVHAEKSFDVQAVVKAHLAIYKELAEAV